jgi:hypothetical protein
VLHVPVPRDPDRVVLVEDRVEDRLIRKSRRPPSATGRLVSLLADESR